MNKIFLLRLMECRFINIAISIATLSKNNILGMSSMNTLQSNANHGRVKCQITQ